MIAMNDGMEMELQPGDAAVIPPGHDAWVVGQDDCEIVDFSDMKDYGKNI
jgi:quercetin dioxygenase-like cupin family protein